MSEENKLLFETDDPRGYHIVLSSDQYYNHIISTIDHNAHTEFTPDEIKECVEEPDVIYQSERIPSSDLYFGKSSATYPELFLRTAVAIDPEDKTGEVMTAHLTKKLSGGKDLRYVNYKSKL